MCKGAVVWHNLDIHREKNKHIKDTYTSLQTNNMAQHGDARCSFLQDKEINSRDYDIVTYNTINVPSSEKAFYYEYRGKLLAIKVNC